MSAATVDYTIECGTDWSVEVPVLDANGNPVDLTGFHARMQGRTSAAATAPEFDLDDVGGGITITPLLGILAPALAKAQTGAITARHIVYDILLTDPAGLASRVQQGTLNFTPAVTR